MTPVTRTSDFADAVIVYGVLTGQLPTRDAITRVLRALRACNADPDSDYPLVEGHLEVRRNTPHVGRDGNKFSRVSM